MIWKIFAIVSFIGVIALGYVFLIIIPPNPEKDDTYMLVEKLDSLHCIIWKQDIRHAGLLYRIQKLELEIEMSRQENNYLVIDRHKGYFWIRQDDAVLYEDICGVGRGSRVIMGRAHDFETPAGKLKVMRKIRSPWWYRPNWFWTEKGLSVPKHFIEYPKGCSYDHAVAFYNSLSRDDKLRVRAVPGYLGKYAIQIASGIYIHYGARLSGRVSHGCIRVSREAAETMYNLLEVGDAVYVY